MSVDEIDRDQLEQFAEAGAQVPASLLLAVLIRLEAAEAELASLKLNSRTSSKPPSSDRHNPNKPGKNKNENERGRQKKDKKDKKKRKPGGQKGRTGKTLNQVSNPDHVVNHALDRRRGKCTHCNASLRGVKVTGFEVRQVHDLPEKIRTEVSEHRAETAQCACCGKKVKAAFPDEVRAAAPYGPRLKSLVVYLQTYQLLPCERISEFMGDVFDCALSAGTICSMVKSVGDRAGPTYQAIKTELLKALYIHCDETGLSVNGSTHWLHTASTPELVYLHIDASRGEDALHTMDILPDYKGRVVHDYLSVYYTLDGLEHSLCNAHHLRDLTCVHEDYGQAWAGAMIDLLLEAKRLKDRERRGGRIVGPKTIERLLKRYCELLDEGFDLNPEPARKPGARGRVKRGKPLNLLLRFDERFEEVLAFLLEDNVPFDNNEAERDLRMMKVKQKISGCFRSFSQSQAFAQLRSIIATAKKRSLNILEILSIIVKEPQDAQKILLTS